MHREAGNLITGGQVVTLRTALYINYSIIAITKHLPRYIALLPSATEYGGVFVFAWKQKLGFWCSISSYYRSNRFGASFKSNNHTFLVIHSHLQTLPEKLIESVTMWPFFLLYAKLCANSVVRLKASVSIGLIQCRKESRRIALNSYASNLYVIICN